MKWYNMVSRENKRLIARECRKCIKNEHEYIRIDELRVNDDIVVFVKDDCVFSGCTGKYTIRRGERRGFYTVVNGRFHDDTGPAVITDYSISWFTNGKLNNKDGPAEIKETSSSWYINGIRHRIDGPAVEWGRPYDPSWWFMDQVVDVKSQKEFEKWIIKNL